MLPGSRSMSTASRPRPHARRASSSVGRCRTWRTAPPLNIPLAPVVSSPPPKPTCLERPRGEGGPELDRRPGAVRDRRLRVRPRAVHHELPRRDRRDAATGPRDARPVRRESPRTPSSPLPPRAPPRRPPTAGRRLPCRASPPRSRPPSCPCSSPAGVRKLWMPDAVGLPERRPTSPGSSTWCSRVSPLRATLCAVSRFGSETVVAPARPRVGPVLHERGRRLVRQPLHRRRRAARPGKRRQVRDHRRREVLGHGREASTCRPGPEGSRRGRRPSPPPSPCSSCRSSGASSESASPWRRPSRPWPARPSSPRRAQPERRRRDRRRVHRLAELHDHRRRRPRTSVAPGAGVRAQDRRALRCRASVL